MLCAIYEYQSHLAGVKTEDKTVKYLHRVTIRELGMLKEEQSASCVAEFSKKYKMDSGTTQQKVIITSRPEGTRREIDVVATR